MIKLEDLQSNATVRGILPDCLVTVANVNWFGSEALELTYKDPGGRVANLLLYRHDEPRLEIVEQGRPLELRWRRWPSPSRFRSAPHPLGVSVRSGIGRPHLIDGEHRVHYLCQPFQREPDFHVTSVNYSFSELLPRAEAPR